MGVEIERKFLLNKVEWNSVNKGLGSYLRQGYLVADPEKTIRVRIADNDAFLTIKGKSSGISRTEFEYSIPVDEAKELLAQFATSSLEKIRYVVRHAGKVWEVDEFLGENEGLMIAEVELESEQEQIELPNWIAEEVSGIREYYNSNLSIHPFKNWKS